LGVSAWAVGRVEAGQGIAVSAGQIEGVPASAVEDLWDGSYVPLTD
jgi:hypothetical protein